ncbi:TAXI family TRAP transporter solute-binding subunit [Rickettsia endosymbiont of Halotydeus destructor]|uniref:TAXI family TRAP transporter solute-binding subunit n=1 Tax=Rickettsia endosymbiont of Halotydeus destructor TaxID=2996754 RepID=UPI003BB2207B
MKNIRLWFVVVSIFFVHSNVLAEQKLVRIGSGSILKGYYSIGLDLCKTIKLTNKDIKCEVVPTSGGVENLKLLKEGKIDLALVQANIAVEAFEGIGYYDKQEKMQNFRQVLNLYDEYFTVIAKDDDKIKVFADIEGKRISNGPSFSSSNITYDAVRKLYNFTKEPIDVDINYEDSIKKFCNKEIDVIMMMVGHPNPLISLIANSCEVDFVAIENARITELIKTNRAFRKGVLHKELYPGITENQNTVIVPAILVTREDIEFELLDKFIGAFHRNVASFKHSNYLLQNLDIKYFADTNNFVLPKHEAVRNRK